MPDKYHFLTLHLEKAIRDLLDKISETEWDGRGGDLRPETRSEWASWFDAVKLKAQAVREAMDE